MKKTIVNSWNEWDPLKHVIVGKNKNTIIDFESSSMERRVSNVTSATQAFYIGSGISKIVKFISSKATKLQTGYIFDYAFVMLLGFSLLLTFFIIYK